jgi:hypothetical protein
VIAGIVRFDVRADADKNSRSSRHYHARQPQRTRLPDLRLPARAGVRARYVLFEQWQDEPSLTAHLANLVRLLGAPAPGDWLPAALARMLDDVQATRYDVIERRRRDHLALAGRSPREPIPPRSLRQHQSATKRVENCGAVDREPPLDDHPVADAADLDLLERDLLSCRCDPSPRPEMRTAECQPARNAILLRQHVVDRPVQIGEHRERTASMIARICAGPRVSKG